MQQRCKCSAGRGSHVHVLVSGALMCDGHTLGGMLGVRVRNRIQAHGLSTAMTGCGTTIGAASGFTMQYSGNGWAARSANDASRVPSSAMVTPWSEAARGLAREERPLVGSWGLYVNRVVPTDPAGLVSGRKVPNPSLFGCSSTRTPGTSRGSAMRGGWSAVRAASRRERWMCSLAVRVPLKKRSACNSSAILRPMGPEDNVTVCFEVHEHISSSSLAAQDIRH